MKWAAGVTGQPAAATGRWGEDLAVKALTRDGYRVRERNFRCPAGEIDIIAMERDVLAFVEVKTRRDPTYDPSWAMTQKKRRHLVQAAQWYLKSRRWSQPPLSRLDVVLITGSPDQAASVQLEIIKGAVLEIPS